MSYQSSQQARGLSIVRIAASSAVIAMVAGSVVRATDYTFSAATTGDYNTAANWTPAGVPAAADAGFIAGGKTATISTNVADAITALSLGGNGATTGAGTLTISLGSLNVSSNIQLGHDAGTTTVGTLNIIGGAVTAGQVVEGEQGTGDNKIVVSGGSLTLNNESYIGANGKGSLLISGNGAVSTKRLDVANALNSTGTLGISGGTLALSGKSYIGLRGAGTFNISGGTVTGNADLGVGQENDTGGGTAPVSRGIINVTGGTSSFGTIVLGEVSTGDNQLNVSAGTISDAGDLYNGANGKGSITVSGTGTLNVVNQMHIGASGSGVGSLTVTGGNLNMTGAGGWILVGQNGQGTFTFSGGAIDTKIISTGQDPNSTGTATQTGGTLRAQTTFIVGETSVAGGTYSVSAGSIDVGTLGLDPDGYGIFVGSYNGKGVFNISGTAAVSDRNGITIGYGQGGPSDGTINVSGGTFSTVNPGQDGRVRIGVYAGATGRLNVSGGSATFAGPILNGVAFGGVGVGGTGLINVSGGSLVAPSMTNETGSTYTQTNGTALLGTVTGGGSIAVSGGTTSVQRLTQSSLSVTGTGTVKILNAATPAASIVGTLTTGGTGKLDITNNGLIVDYTGTSTPLNAVRVAAGAGQIVGTITPADTRQGIAYAEASALGISSFLGTPVDGTTVVVQSRLKGDATFNGTVDFDDLLALAKSYNDTATGRTWVNGDFNYDGITNFNDLLLLAKNYNVALSAGQAEALGAAFSADVTLAQSLVPEPTTITVLGIAGAMFAGRRRRA